LHDGAGLKRSWKKKELKKQEVGRPGEGKKGGGEKITQKWGGLGKKMKKKNCSHEKPKKEKPEAKKSTSAQKKKCEIPWKNRRKWKGKKSKEKGRSHREKKSLGRGIFKKGGI